MTGFRVRLAPWLLAWLCLALACQTFRAIEDQPVAGDEFDRRGQYDLDDDLCWQSVHADPPSERTIEEAHAACMEARGWTAEP